MNIEKDKLQHFFVCMILAAINPLLAIAAGIGKELYDKYVKCTMFDCNDILADAAGAVIGSCIWFGIN